MLQGSALPEFGYAGMYYHARSGLNLTLYRAYSPNLGRWLGRDPLGESAGVNLFGYVRNNPVSRIDPLGLITDEYANRALSPGSMDLSGVGVGLAGFGTAIGSGAVTTTSGAVSLASAFGGSIALGVNQLARNIRGSERPGRIGNDVTRDQILDIVQKLEQAGYEVTNYGSKSCGDPGEEYIKGPMGGLAGSAYPDITAVRDGLTLRINTVDMDPITGMPTQRELEAMARILNQRPGDRLIWIPKRN